MICGYHLASLDELDGEELVGADIPHQLGHPEVARPDVPDHLVPLHRSARSNSEAARVSRAAAEDEDEDDEGVGMEIGRLGPRGGPWGMGVCGNAAEVGWGVEAELSLRWAARRSTPTMCRRGSRPGLPSRRDAVQARAVGL